MGWPWPGKARTQPCHPGRLESSEDQAKIRHHEAMSEDGVTHVRWARQYALLAEPVTYPASQRSACRPSTHRGVSGLRWGSGPGWRQRGHPGGW